MKHSLLAGALLCAAFVSTVPSLRAADRNTVTVAVISLNDFHAGLLPNPAQNVPGAAWVVQTLDSLKSVYPYNVTVSAGDNFGGSFFYNATRKTSLMPQMFKDMGIRVSVLGNHEFDEGQEVLAKKWNDVEDKPRSWDVTYVGANVREAATGRQPDYVQPWAVVPVRINDHRTVNVAFVGLSTSNTPWQTSARRVAGLTFDGNYTGVLDSLRYLPNYKEVADAPVRLILCHIGTEMKDGRAVWEDRDEENLKTMDNPDFCGVLSGHTHLAVIGETNSKRPVPVVQGLWHGIYVSMLKCEVDTLTNQVVKVTPELVRVNPKAKLDYKAARLQAQIEEQYHTTLFRGIPLSRKLTEADQAIEHDRRIARRQSPIGRLVCESYAAAYRRDQHLPDDALVVGVSHFGSIRSGFPKGDITVLNVGEVLPFANKLNAYRYTGRELLDLMNFGYTECKLGFVQTSGVIPVLDKRGRVTSISLQLPTGRVVPIRPNTKLVLVADDYMTTGGDGYPVKLFPKADELPHHMPTSTDSFIAYLRTLKKIG